MIKLEELQLLDACLEVLELRVEVAGAGLADESYDLDTLWTRAARQRETTAGFCSRITFFFAIGPHAARTLTDLCRA